MDESRKQFLEWWRHPEQEELRKSCAEGWGEKIWSASRSAISIELPAKNDISSDDYSFLTWLIGVMEETLVFRNAQKPSAPLESK